MKVKNRRTIEMIAGAVIGPIERPVALVAGLMHDGELVIAGRSTDLTSAQSAQLAAVLEPAGPGHPWPESVGSGVFGIRKKVPITRIVPNLVVEVSADTGMQGGRYRHAIRFARVRLDMSPGDVDPL